MTTKVLEPVKINGTLYYFDPDIFGRLQEGEPCVNLNGDGRGYLKATIEIYRPCIAGAMYKIWASSDITQVFPRISTKEVEEFEANPYTLLEVEIDTRDKIQSGNKGFLKDNPMAGQPQTYAGGYVSVTKRLYNVHKPCQTFDVDPNTSAYKFLAEGGFSCISDGDYHIFIINGFGYRFKTQL